MSAAPNEQPYWQRQTPGQPVFPDLLWSRPENRQYAGKLLIVGGNAHGFASPAEAYAEAEKAGIGTARVLLPNALEKTVSKLFPAAEFAPSTPSGSFSQKALAELLSLAYWADAVLLDGDLGRNSETAILLEKFTAKHRGPLALASDAADYFITPHTTILDRPETLLILNFAQLQKLAVNARFTTAFTSTMGLVHVTAALHDFARRHQARFVIQHLNNTIVAADDKISTTKHPHLPLHTTKTAAHATVWWLQHPSKSFEALTTACTELQ